jgi:Cu-Zn family superoxide dismutase
MKKATLFTLALLGAAGYVRAETAEAKIQSTSGAGQIGTVKFEDTTAGLKVTAQIDNAPAGQHGFHIHEFGSCDDMGNKAGSHYNPEGHQHGNAVKDGPMKAHPGDLGNITVGKDGKGTLEATLQGVSLSGGKNNVGGRAVILHEKVDDFGQPTGNAGGRIGCGQIIITGK